MRKLILFAMTAWIAWTAPGLRAQTGWSYVPFAQFNNLFGGDEPVAGLIQARDGNLYGTTPYGGVGGYGTVFQITTNGVFTTLYSFTGGADGGDPLAGLLQAADGSLYDTTEDGGAHYDGTVFRITTNGVLTTLYSFTGEADGYDPVAGLIQAADGNLYGTTPYGGVNYEGTVFQITTNGVLTTLYAFAGEGDGEEPVGSLIQAADGNLYGTTEFGGADGDGTVFQITTNGVLTTLYSFTGGLDGEDPMAGLVQAPDGVLYGTTPYGGANYDGTVFKITTNGVLTTLYSFAGGGGRRGTCRGFNPGL